MTSCQQELRSPIWAARRFRGTNSITINLKENDDVIIARLCDFGKTFYFLFIKRLCMLNTFWQQDWQQTTINFRLF